MTKFKIGDIVMVSPENDNDSYNSFRDSVLRITHVATNQSQHPGYDSGMKGEGLYDFVNAKTGTEIPCSLYDYELIPA